MVLTWVYNVFCVPKGEREREREREKERERERSCFDLMAQISCSFLCSRAHLNPGLEYQPKRPWVQTSLNYCER
jgi:hypothetical protein